jgi:hypothetical protein
VEWDGISIHHPQILRPWNPLRAQREIERLTDQLSALRQVLTLCLALVDEMKDGTIDKILAKDDVELAIEFLMGKRKL